MHLYCAAFCIWFYSPVKDFKVTSKIMRELIPRQVDKKSRVPKERGVWNSQGGRKDTLFPLYIP